MIVISENLLGLVRLTHLCPEDAVEEFSIGLRLDGRVRRMRHDIGTRTIVYGSDYAPDDFFEEQREVNRDLSLLPGDRVLACSRDVIRMPDTYFGLVQTKGSLARLFVSATCNDGQIEPGFTGKVTLELSNDSTCEIVLPIGSLVAQMFVFRCSTRAQRPYDGRYQNADGPTLADFKERTRK
jgi:dCTP deaminase